MPVKTGVVADGSLYAVLGLPEPSTTARSISSAQIKVAFRRALLKHHPDKAARLLDEPISRTTPLQDRPSAKYDIDTICLARDTLVDPVKRREYDKTLQLENVSHDKVANLHPTELETLDLDDMAYDEENASWAKTCRCGNTKAYEVSEEDLEIASSDGGREVLVGCGGCSLFVRVVFEAIDAD